MSLNTNLNLHFYGIYDDKRFEFDTIQEVKKNQFSLRLPKGRDIWIHSSMILLALAGILMSVSASMSTNVVYFELMKQGAKQFFYVFIGYLGYFVLAKYIDLKKLKNWILPIMIGTIVLLIIPLFGTARNGALAWIDLPGGATIQPSEFTKLVIIAVNVVYLGDLKTRKKEFFDIIQMPLMFLLTSLFIVVFLQKDLGSGVVIAIVGFGTFLLAGHKKLRKSQRYLIILIFIAVLAIPMLLTEAGLNWIESNGILQGYMLNRFKVAVNPFIDVYGSGYQLINGLVAMVRGGWFGVGFGNGLQKYGYLPAAKTDYILAVVGEEMGYFGILSIFGMYFVIFYRLLKHSFNTSNEKNQMIIFGVLLYLMMHFILNVGGVTGLIPLTGVPLLLLSAGGSSTISMMMALGMAQYAIVEESKKF